ncbi:hypothetical protein NEF87_000493 [Candidatus Lokiarchaeum ossiferum]|uniref:Uncharacterized protein n=1 Tax=Candidatus Lokiarchaeum ossiferum TaxID=2951803 RepID=A0ABY6HLM6_9ARCH|nr:hypothetical protein NEF87_000493 [Candidatus Lokiarchaeum sp. B-35]
MVIIELKQGVLNFLRMFLSLVSSEALIQTTAKNQQHESVDME